MAAEEEITDPKYSGLKDWERRQCRTFAKWVNMYLAKKGHTADVGERADLFAKSFSNGIRPMKLLNALYDVPIKKHKAEDPTKEMTDVFKLNNQTQLMKMFKAAEVDVEKINLKKTSIMQGDFKSLCGMVWSIILDFNIKDISVEDATAKQGLLIWCRKKTVGYNPVNGNINNFSKDWKDGNAFLALVDRHTTGMVDYEQMQNDGASAEEKLDAAFSACEELGVYRLLEIDDLQLERPDEKAVMTYVSELFKLFSQGDLKENAASHIGKFLNFQRRMESLGNDYENQFDGIVAWIEAKCEKLANTDAPANQTMAGDTTVEFKKYLLEEKPQKLVEVIDVQDLYSNIQAELRVNGRNAFVPPVGKEPEVLNAKVHELGDCETDFLENLRQAKLGFVNKLDDGGHISDERMEEFRQSFVVFDHDRSGHLNKLEFKAALSAVGIALNEEDLDKVYSELSSQEGFIEEETYINYLVEFFSQEDNADAVFKSLQVLGDPANMTEEMLNTPPLTEEDVAFLMEKSANGSLEEFIQSTFAEH